MIKLKGLMLGALLFLCSCGDYLVEYNDHSITITLENRDKIALEVYSPTIIKVAMAECDSLLNLESIVVDRDLKKSGDFWVGRSGDIVHLATDSLIVGCNIKNGDLTFMDQRSNILLSDSSKSLIKYQDSLVGTQYKISQRFLWDSDEVIYGLGQHESSSINMRGQKLELVQKNTRIANPIMLSTKGYGVYWDNYSRTIFDDSNNNGIIASEVADKIQYYFVKGAQFDDIISGLHTLSGNSPMLPHWAFGYVQSRNRYQTRDELVGVVKRQRELGVPMDVIILDYLHWNIENGFGSMEFDPKNFPNPESMIEELHTKYNCKILASVWPLFKRGNDNWHKFNDKNYLLNEVRAGANYDAYNPAAGELYWKLVKENYWDRGVDGIWFDATEPEGLDGFEKSRNYLGATAKYLNLYSYFDMKNIYCNQIKVDSNRVFVLTRSSFLGQQQYGSVAWSGDIEPTFESLKQQIPTGLNYCMTGLPYWNTDIGGYLGGDPNEKSYQEVFVRWFQYGAFTPFFRSHGRRHPVKERNTPNEIWSYGVDNQAILTNYIRLRYRLLPYIYTLSHRVSAESYTMMRALAFDFLDDKEVYNINDQFLLGSNIMVCPVTEAGAICRDVYFPMGANWYEFRSGKIYNGGDRAQVDAPIEWMPLFIKAGTILPLADVMNYSNESPLNELEVRVYPGADGEFTLYEDEGDNYNYADGKYSEIKFSYDDEKNTLIIAKREGEYNGMLSERIFNVVLVHDKEGLGVEKCMHVEHVVKYNGEHVEVKLY